MILPVLTMSITFAFYTLVQKKELTASKGMSRLARGADISLYQYDRVRGGQGPDGHGESSEVVGTDGSASTSSTAASLLGFRLLA
jgi:hypothetical protein